MAKWRSNLGVRGEKAAVKELQRRGCRILECNYFCHGGEIDIIAEHRNVIVFVEVKTRSPRSWGVPEEAVTGEKQQRIFRAARHYLNGYMEASPMRFDAVSVYADDEGNITRVEMIENAFHPDGSVEGA